MFFRLLCHHHRTHKTASHLRISFFLHAAAHLRQLVTLFLSLPPRRTHVECYLPPSTLIIRSFNNSYPRSSCDIFIADETTAHTVIANQSDMNRETNRTRGKNNYCRGKKTCVGLQLKFLLCENIRCKKLIKICRPNLQSIRKRPIVPTTTHKKN